MMMREFSFDLVEHMARARSPSASGLDPAIKSYLGAGNATGIGLNLVFANHPRLMSRWLEQREFTLAVARRQEVFKGSARTQLKNLLDRYITYLREDRTGDGGLIASKDGTLRDVIGFKEHLDAAIAAGPQAATTWQTLCDPVQSRMNLEAQEIVNALLLEAHPAICDEVDPHSSVSESLELIPEMPVHRLLELANENFAWALRVDIRNPEEDYWIWYRSIEGEEPRMAVAANGDVPQCRNLVRNLPALLQSLIADASPRDRRETVARFLLEHPQHRDIVRIVQSEAGMRYGTLRANMLNKDFSPLHLTRFVLQALKGMEKSSTMGDRWVRGVFLQGAPTRDSISAGTASPDWVYPTLPSG
jgi:hypothetical protein